MMSPMISTPLITPSVPTPKRKKNKKKQVMQAQNGSGAQWKSSAQQQAYSSKLLQALRRDVSITRSPHRRAVRETADRALAVAAKGKTRWSRAILQKSRLIKVKFTKVNRGTRVLQAHSSSWTKKPISRLSILRLKSSKNKAAAEVQRKAKVLGRLVPGCRKEAFPVILEEAADYIAALQMQVRAMSALTHLLSASTTSAAQHTPS